jgi:integrase
LTLARALVSGCGYGELTRLTVADFHPDSGTLLIREAKSGKARHVPLEDGALAFFEAITAGRPAAEPNFRTADGRIWGKSYQARPLAQACQAARIDPPITFHGLRHTWASHRVMKGAPLIVVAQVLGHADTRMVEKHYGHLAPSYVRDVVRATALDLGPASDGKVTAIRGLGSRDVSKLA